MINLPDFFLFRVPCFRFFIFLSFFYSSSAFSYTWDYAKMRCETTSNPMYNYCSYLPSSGQFCIVRNNGIFQTCYAVGRTLCSDGVTSVFDPSTCPSSVNCPDGSTASTLDQCPVISVVNCPDGSSAFDISLCPASNSNFPISSTLCGGLSGYPFVSTPAAVCDIFLTRNNVKTSPNITNSSSDGSLQFTCNTDSGSSLGSFYCTAGYSSQCSSGNTWDSSYSNCSLFIPPVCSGFQNPVSDNCVYSSDSPVDCADGSIVYSPATCPNTLINSLLTKSGQSVTCSDGQVSTFPSTCLDKYVSRQMSNLLSNPYVIGAIALTSRFVPGGSFAVAVGKLLSDSSIKADVQISTKIDNASRLMYGTVETDIPTYTLGKAVSEYIQSSPSSSYASQLSSGFSNGASKSNLIIDSNTGVVTVQGSSVPLSYNQIGSVARYLNDVAPIPAAVSAFVDTATIPWLSPALDAIEGDFANVFDPITPSQPLNFPNAVSSSLSSSPVSNALPKIASLTKDSALTYTKATQSVLSKTLSASNSLSTPSSNSLGVVDTVISSALPSIDPAIDGQFFTIPPVPPSIVPDTWMYTEFLKFSNPFSFRVSDYLPTLPSSVTCSYEVHTTLHIPFIGNKQFDVAPCIPLQPLRDVLNWAFAVMTAFVCFNVIFRSQI